VIKIRDLLEHLILVCACFQAYSVLSLYQTFIDNNREKKMSVLNSGSSEVILQKQKVVYHPIEAAILWSSSGFNEDAINRFNATPSNYKEVLELIKQQWPSVYLNTERIFDGIMNEELCCRRNGAKSFNINEISFDDPDITVRHIDLKHWISTYYPHEKPDFLFSPIEKTALSNDIETVFALIVEREALKARLSISELEISQLKISSKAKHDAPIRLHRRTEGSYLAIIGALLWVLQGTTPSGRPYSILKNLEAIISIILAQFKGYPGLSESNLRMKFAEAKKSVERQP